MRGDTHSEVRRYTLDPARFSSCDGSLAWTSRAVCKAMEQSAVKLAQTIHMHVTANTIAIHLPAQTHNLSCSSL